MNPSTRQAWLLAATMRALVMLVPPALLWWVLFRPASSPLHDYRSYALGLLLALVLHVVISTVKRYRYRQTNPPVVAAPDADTVSLKGR